MLSRILLILLVSGIWSCPQLVAEVSPPELKWNQLIDSWQLLGPFPKPDTSQDGLGFPFVEDEAHLEVGDVVFYEGKLYTWKAVNQQAISFKNVFGLNNQEGNHQAAYAWAEFTSPISQKAILSIGYDDHYVAWLNGEEVGRGADDTAANLDQSQSEVQLRQGTNRLLVKVTQNYSGWELAALLRPAGLKEPLFTVRTDNKVNIQRTPTMRVEFLDAERKVLETHDASGGRAPRQVTGNGGYYPVYASAPVKKPAFVKLCFPGKGYSSISQTFPWEEALKKPLRFRLLSATPVQLFVFHEKTQMPLKDAEIWLEKEQQSVRTDEAGQVLLPDLDPMEYQAWVVARGYEAQKLSFRWPRGRQEVFLKPGGKTLKGRVLDPDRNPVPNALVDSKIYQGFAPSARTNEKGEYEFYGFPDSVNDLHPSVTAKNFLGTQRQTVKLMKESTSWDFQLMPGATVYGTVTDRESGKPVANVPIKFGESRFMGSDEMIEVRTDASGKFSIGEIPPGPVIMHAISEDYAPQIQIAEATTGKPAEVNFELSPGKSITGRIVDVEGKPITNVWLITDTWDKYRMFNREARTDADGKFELVHMPDTAAEVHILKQGYINIRDRSFQGGEHVDLVMKPEITLRFVVRDTEAKTTVPNLAIAVGRLWSSNDDYYWSSNEWETTRYYDALAGEMKIEIDETMTYQTAYRFRAPGYEEQIVKIDPELNESQVYQVEMKRAELLSAQVVHSHSGEPAAGVKIVLADPNDRFHPDHYVDFMTPWDYLENRDYSGVVLQTDVNGQFRFSRPKHPQTILVIVSPDGSFQAVPRFMSLLQAQEELKRPLVIPIEQPAQIKGQVLLGGKPVPNVIMKIHWNPQPDHGSSMEQMFGVGGQITTDASGHFEFPPIARGTYTLYRVHMVQSNRYSTSLVFDSKTVSLESGESREVVFDRNGGLTLKGILKGETGEPVAGCVVSLTQSGASQPLEIVEANDKGEFQFDHLLPGEYQLEAKHYSILEYLDVDQSGQLTVQVAEEMQPVQVQLKKINRNQPVLSGETSVFSLSGSLPHELEFTHPETQKPYRLSEQTGKVVVLCATARWSTDLKALQKQLEPWQNHSRMDLLCFHQGTKEEFDTYCQQQSVEWKLPVICSKDNQQSLLLTHFGLMPGLSLIVGPDGLFVGDQFGHAELNSRLTQLQQKMGDSPMEQPDRKKLSITLASNTLSGGILDASLKLSALDQNGKVVETARFGMPVEATRVIWNYSAIGVAEVQAELKVPDQPAMPQKLNAGEEPLEMKFQLDAPRLITGSILTSENQPVPGMEIIVMRIGAGYTRIGNDLKTDESGKFTMPCFPGNYYLAAKSNKQFSVPESTKSVSVASGANPEPVAYVAYPAISVRLKILKSDGTPADQATVASNVGTEQSKTDENGEVELSGISSEGQTQLWFQKDSEYGSFILQSPDPGKLYTASIGPQGNDNQNPSPIAAKSLRNLEVISVAGEKTTLPTGQSRSVVVIGPIWRLDTQLMISKASSFCEEKRARLILVATDPDYEQFHTLLEQLKTDHLLSYYLASNPSDENQWHQVILPRTILVDENLVQLEALFTDQDANLSPRALSAE